MPLTPLCPTCERRFNAASKAMRHHATFMETNFRLMGACREEERRELAQVLVETFNDAQEAWGDYREHLTEHGLLLTTK